MRWVALVTLALCSLRMLCTNFFVPTQDFGGFALGTFPSWSTTITGAAPPPALWLALADEHGSVLGLVYEWLATDALIAFAVALVGAWCMPQARWRHSNTLIAGFAGALALSALVMRFLVVSVFNGDVSNVARLQWAVSGSMPHRIVAPEQFVSATPVPVPLVELHEWACDHWSGALLAALILTLLTRNHVERSLVGSQAV